MPTPSIARTLAAASEKLGSVSSSPRLDAELLLAHCLEASRSHLRAWPEKPVEPAQLNRFETLLARRLKGEPIAYLVGEREFWSTPLRVTPEVLVPRPETELLVELALSRLPAGGTPRIADLGTGSGAIAIALARECRRCQVIATDVAESALAVARWNAEALELRNVAFRLGHWFDALDDARFDLILSNPPYIREDDPHLHLIDVRFEPPHALISGKDGLDALRTLAAGAGRHLAPGGWLMLEHGYDQGKAVRRLLEKAGFTAVETRQDLAGHDRVTLGRRA